MHVQRAAACNLRCPSTAVGGAHPMKRTLAIAVTAAAFFQTLFGAAPAAAAAGPAYSLVTVSPYGGEPSLAVDRKGRLYESTPSGGTLTYRSTNHGITWTKTATADPNSGDDCLATDQANAVYLCNLAGSEGSAPLQADVWKSTDHGDHWRHG